MLGILKAFYRITQEESSIFWEVIVSAILSKKSISTCVLFRTVSEIELFRYTLYRLATCHALKHELQSALMLTVEFSKMHYTRKTVPTLSLGQQIPVIATLGGGGATR
jgi:hypothetical protein